MEIICQQCGAASTAARSTKRFCSDQCSRRFREGKSGERTCKLCNAAFAVVTRSDANRQYCSKQCAKKGYSKNVRGWQEANPEAMREYGRRWSAKTPGYYRDKARRERLAILELLGAKCVVCSVTNPFWLHVDYIPTTRDLKYRHPRNIGFVRRNQKDFRILCANHHYELTLSGRIEGTSIRQ